MNLPEAHEWLKGLRSSINTIPRDPIDTWEVRIAQADAVFMQQAYWLSKAWNEEVLK